MSYVKELYFGKGKRKVMTATEKAKAKELIAQKEKEDSQLVKGIFKNLEAPGGNLEFAYKAYDGHPVQFYNLQDGQTYELPLGVAKHINNQTRVPRKEYVNPSAEGQMPQTRIAGYKQRYQFLSTEFM